MATYILEYGSDYEEETLFFRGESFTARDGVKCLEYQVKEAFNCDGDIDEICELIGRLSEDTQTILEELEQFE